MGWWSSEPRGRMMRREADAEAEDEGRGRTTKDLPQQHVAAPSAQGSAPTLGWLAVSPNTLSSRSQAAAPAAAAAHPGSLLLLR